MSTIWGAIRWDFTYRGLGNSVPTGDAIPELQSLETAQWRSRAPLHFQSTGTNTGTWADTQTTFDAEITAAVSAGLKYWAFLRYSQGSIVNDAAGVYGLQYYQASTKNNLINWCSMTQLSLMGTTGNYTAQITSMVTEFNQSNYQKVLSNRPVLYIYYLSADLTTYWGGSLTNLAAMITALRSATVASGLATPYIVVLNGLDVSVLNAIGADAISNYVPGVTYNLQCPWTTYEPLVEAYWASQAALGKPIVPIAGMGWDSRARKQRPPPWESSALYPYFGLNSYVINPTNAQITAHLTAGVNYINANPTICPSTLGLIYAWNEHSECGFPLNPTLGDPTGSRCTAAGSALIGN